ncbi:MAG: DUF4338 domain-containing protein [Gammaproteobacteria bacterium]|nr:DUF4338 domain-containing protein [Gammaproteobacteria bacterium]
MNKPAQSSKAYPLELNLRLVQSDEMTQYDDLMAKHHRRGALRRIGHELHYVAGDQRRWIALISFSPAALKCAARDRWIGLISQIHNDRLRFIVNNSRFLILPGHHYPNLGSRILSACRKRLASDWMRHFSRPLLLLETFVDTDFHEGIVYRVDNWLLAGKTRGCRRVHGGYAFRVNQAGICQATASGCPVDLAITAASGCGSISSEEDESPTRRPCFPVRLFPGHGGYSQSAGPTA